MHIMRQAYYGSPGVRLNKSTVMKDRDGVVMGCDGFCKGSRIVFAFIFCFAFVFFVSTSFWILFAFFPGTICLIFATVWN